MRTPKTILLVVVNPGTGIYYEFPDHVGGVRSRFPPLKTSWATDTELCVPTRLAATCLLVSGFTVFSWLNGS